MVLGRQGDRTSDPAPSRAGQDQNQAQSTGGRAGPAQADVRISARYRTGKIQSLKPSRNRHKRIAKSTPIAASLRSGLSEGARSTRGTCASADGGSSRLRKNQRSVPPPFSVASR